MSSVPGRQFDFPIVKFYGGSRDCFDRTLDDILAWSDEELERSHNYIQILFPVPEGSFYNDLAPLLDDGTIEAFNGMPLLQTSMQKALLRMLRFYGFSFVRTKSSRICERFSISSITPSPELFPRAAASWFNSHNNLRITRIIRSLRLCGLEQDAQTFYNALKELYESRQGYPQPIDERTFTFWKRAATRDLRIPPNLNEAEGERRLQDICTKRGDRRGRV